MSNKYSEALLSAIDIIAKQRVAEADYDKTVIAEVIGRQKNGSYLLKYENAFIEAFSQEDLMPSTMVYVLIPQDNMGEEKQIIGKVYHYAKKSTETILLWEDIKGIIIKNNMIIGFVDENNQNIYFHQKGG